MNPVLELFRRAAHTDDAEAMREGVELMFGDMEMPQSGERIRGRDRMRDAG
ncbi:hypothetical protein SK803_12850 [Lentzea sp. BCCO 10_0856]|uniref:SnoaL-like domain-containing protein n=1 Tax=Lentzea miocenica TaxID=3095431 RepID=A0ABU4SYX3_9PSEU|nr:hypothetical protein [Lentzea sp. BCCO 10_0856]MDX8031109.1 hypothetical protein [Lentzea sp. BCCO 10_0856]